MSFSITQVKENLIGMGHSGTLNKVRNIEALFERVANTMLLKCSPLETIRVVGLTQTVHNALYNYSLPSDFNSIIDLYPQAERTNLDQSTRVLAERFDLRKSLADKTISIESSEGSKLIRINWKVRTPKVLSNMDSYNGNGTWIAVGTASGIVTDTIYKYSGGGSVRFDVAATGNGISNIGMDAIDMTDEDEVASIIIPIYFGSVSALTSVSFTFGNDITTAYWTPTTQTTQADGTAFRAGWNILKFSWAGATETGTVNPATIDSAKLTINSTGAISDVRVDNILFVIGYPFDIKYYSKYLFKNSSGTWLSRPTSDDDVVVVDNDGLQIFLLECLIAMAHQLEASDSSFDITFAEKQLLTLYPAYKGEHPSQSKKATQSYGMTPRFKQ